jgi:hypothetical protein
MKGLKQVSLFAIDNSEKRNVPTTRARDYAQWISQLRAFDSKAEVQIRAAINDVFDQAAATGDTVYSSAIPGKDWTGTVYDPIYQCLLDENQSRLFFGLLVWDVAVHRRDNWYFKPKDNDEVESGTYYFLKTN